MAADARTTTTLKLLAARVGSVGPPINLSIGNLSELVEEWLFQHVSQRLQKESDGKSDGHRDNSQADHCGPSTLVHRALVLCGLAVDLSRVLTTAPGSGVNDAWRSVVCERDAGKSFDRRQGSWALGRHEGSAAVGIGVHDGTSARGLAKGSVTDAGELWHGWCPRGMGNLPGEDCRALVGEDRDARIARSTRVLTDDSTARRCRLDRTAVGASERRIRLSQRRAHRGARRCNCRRWGSRGAGAS